ncbi:helix-turn-helix domain-containing protein [Nocardia sp. NPDC050697]|uniref:TetR/AcrR family transcriptional regulator n=1 Tax=Nocardia sp. NPDC050697 TaxID=3155158 RepID=UPI0033F8794A
MSAQRADWQRNHQRLLEVAAAVVARDGAGASLEAIAREAGIGSATLHRHFPSRHALLDEIFLDGVTALSRRADEPDDEPGRALRRWVEELTAYAASTRGLAATLATERASELDCRGILFDAATTLTRRAATTLRPGVTATDLLRLSTAISTATEGDPDTARRLIRLALAGVSLEEREPS